MKRIRQLASLAALTLLVAAGRPAAAQGDPPAFTQAELEQLLAHVALYPDELLSQILMASTYPLEVVSAARWVGTRPDLSGDAASAAAAERGWAPSVAALAAFPEILKRMDADLEWTRMLGEAFLLQEAEVLATVQALRRRALAAGTLSAIEHLQVHDSGTYIQVRPARREIVYVPYYQPAWAYGGWWHPAHPPWYWTPPRRVVHAGYLPAFHSGFLWGNGVWLSTGFFYSSIHWPRSHVVILSPPRHYVHVVRAPGRPAYRGHRDWSRPDHRWKHDPHHRRGVTHRRRPDPGLRGPVAGMRSETGGRAPQASRALERRHAAPTGSGRVQRSQAGSVSRVPAGERSRQIDRTVPRVPGRPAGGAVSPTERPAVPAGQPLRSEIGAGRMLRTERAPRASPGSATQVRPESRRQPGARPPGGAASHRAPAFRDGGRSAGTAVPPRQSAPRIAGAPRSSAPPRPAAPSPATAPPRGSGPVRQRAHSQPGAVGRPAAEAHPNRRSQAGTPQPESTRRGDSAPRGRDRR
ncbi:MAG: DUF3300 domain-containing protein [Chromatiales bacterium]|nr:DUF3300 domain-containing protein [Chromatiales bacterium]